MPTQTHDCLILGGGPAGCTLALLLARQGIDVALADDGRPRRSGPFETVLAGARATFERLELFADGAPGITVDPLRHGAIWGQDALAWRPPEEPGLLLDRDAFDAGLRAAVAAAGCARYGAARRESGGYRCGEHHVVANTIVWSTGRSLVGDLPSWQATAAATMAFTVVGEPDARDRGHAVVEAVPDGWIWLHAPVTGPAAAAVFCDRDARHAGANQQRVRDLLATSIGPAARMQNVEVRFANDATPRMRPIADGALLCGDAAAAIDPLASQGVEKAVAAAEHAAAAVRSGLQHPEWWPRLRAIQQRWERDLLGAHQRVADDYYLREGRFADRPFWQQRRRPATPPATVDGPLTFARSVRPSRVLVRHRTSFIEVDGLLDERDATGLVRIGRVPVTELAQLFARPVALQVAIQNAAERPNLFVLSPADIDTAIRELLSRGWLVPAGPESR